MPAWNPRPDWFREAVSSALGQEGCSFELIIVDDGSSAPVAELLADVSDSRLRVTRIVHGGVCRARNIGIHTARGQFLRFVDADDVLEPSSTTRLLRMAKERNAISYGATVVCDEQLRPIGVKRSRLEGWIAEQCLLYRFDVMHVSMLFPRRVVEAAGEWEPSMSQCGDWDFVLRALEHAPAYGEQESAVLYRRHGTSLSSDLQRAVWHEARVVARYFERHPEQAGTALQREAEAKLLIVRAATSRALGNRRTEQLRLLAGAVALHPRRATEEVAAVLLHRARTVRQRLTERGAARRSVRERLGAMLVERLALSAPSRRQRFALVDDVLTDEVRDHPLHVLDAGCGDGLLSLELAKRHPTWTFVGVDLREELLEIALTRALRRGLQNVRFARADLTKPLPEAGFDAVLAIECLVEIPDDAAALQNMAASLASGGTLLVHVPESSWSAILPGSESTWRDQVRQGYSAYDIDQALRGVGLEVRGIHPTYRGTVVVAQELLDRLRLRDRALPLRALAFPLVSAAVQLERRGLTWGNAHALLAIARKPATNRKLPA